MKQFITELEDRIAFLQNVIEQIDKKADSYPEGHLRISRSGKMAKYFIITEKGDNHGEYIFRKNEKIARLLAQKDYERKYKVAALDEIKHIKDFLRGYDSDRSEACFSSLNEIRKTLVNPFEVSDVDFINSWKMLKYVGKSFDEDDDTEYFTDKGERVRSKTEILIANTLNKNDIPYKYECPLQLGDRIIYPDFTVLNVRLKKIYYWEHFGRMDDADYCNKAIAKINSFIAEGIMLGSQLILTYETSGKPIGTKVISKVIEHYLM